MTTHRRGYRGRRALTLLLAACLATLPVSTWAEGTACTDPGIGPRVSIRSAPGVVAYRVVAPSGATSILMGSMHLPDDRIPIPDLSVLDGARRLVLEIVPGSPTVRSRFTPVDLTTLLTTDQLTMLRIWMGCWLPPSDEAVRNGVVNMALHFPLDIVAFMAIPPGWPNRHGITREKWLTDAAKTRGIPVVGLETPAEEVEHRNQLPERVLINSLQSALSPRGVAAAAAAVAGVADGDDAAVFATVRSVFGDPADAEMFMGRMISDRNAAWMDRLQTYLDAPAVIAVGAGHLAGPQGLVTLLQVRGYSVEPVTLPATTVGEGPATR